MTLQEIEHELLTATEIPPGRLAELLVLLSAKYAETSNRLEDILLKKPSIWNGMRDDFKSDTACERAWQGSEIGMEELKQKMSLKKIEKMMSAAKTMIQVRTNEAHGVY